jgi:hypothetical protein
MKYIFGFFFILGVPLACLLVLQIARRSQTSKRGTGLAMLILGWVVVSLTLLSYIPMIILSFSDPRISKIDEIFGLFVWLIPGISLILTGRSMRKSDSENRK